MVAGSERMATRYGFTECCDTACMAHGVNARHSCDALGRRTVIARSGSAMSETRTDIYGYNARGELVSGAKLGGPSSLTAEYAYQYDDIGNRLTSLDLGTNRTYTANNLNQYTLVGRGDPTAPEEEFLPQFDDDGNQTLVKTATGIWSVIYNGENRPTLWSCIQSNNSNNTNNQTISMSFDRMGRRVTKNNQRFVYDGYLQIANFEHQTSNFKLQTFIWDPTEKVATRPLVWITPATNHQSPTTNFYTHDGNKNVSEVVAENGEVTSHHEYAPFGEVIFQSENHSNILANNPFVFSSDWADTDLNLLYFNWRYYNSDLGRWCSRDPLYFVGAGEYLFLDNSQLGDFDFGGLISGRMILFMYELAKYYEIRSDQVRCETRCENGTYRCADETCRWVNIHTWTNRYIIARQAEIWGDGKTSYEILNDILEHGLDYVKDKVKSYFEDKLLEMEGLDIQINTYEDELQLIEKLSGDFKHYSGDALVINGVRYPNRAFKTYWQLQYKYLTKTQHIPKYPVCTDRGKTEILFIPINKERWERRLR